MTTGLTLGKFAPFHRGHQHVIETAIAENEHVVVLIYDAPDVACNPLTTRADWIRRLHPQVEVMEARDGPTDVGRDPEITAMHDAYLQKTLAGRDITRFYSSEFYGQHVSLALGAEDRRVDPERTIVPVSGTIIRSDPFRFRAFIEPFVYWDLIVKVVFLGAPSTGKSTLVQCLAESFQTAWMPEYGREYWEQNHVDRRLSPSQLTEIAIEHRRREYQCCHEANRFLFIDTDATTTHLFSRSYHGYAETKLAELANQCGNRYDLCFVCQPDIPYDDTWDRSGEVQREVFQRQVETDLESRKTPFIRLFGSLDRRIREATTYIEGFEKFGPGIPLPRS